MSVHESAECRTCGWTHDGPGADQAAARHSDKKRDVPHPTVTRSHPRHLCTPECSDEKRSR